MQESVCSSQWSNCCRCSFLCDHLRMHWILKQLAMQRDDWTSLKHNSDHIRGFNLSRVVKGINIKNWKSVGKFHTFFCRVCRVINAELLVWIAKDCKAQPSVDPRFELHWSWWASESWWRPVSHFKPPAVISFSSCSLRSSLASGCFNTFVLLSFSDTAQ